MKTAIFGGSGFIGMELARDLTGRGYEVTVISRKERPAEGAIRTFTWRQLQDQPELLEGYDAFVNLAGESINQRWTKKAKDRILASRIQATRAVAELVERLKVKPEVVVNGSGMSIYGYSDHETFDEQSPSRLTDFLARTVDHWEREADRLQGVRLVKLRIGLVLGRSGGAFPLMMLPYRLFVGGRVGSGKQWHSWIHIKDMVGIIRYAIEHRDVEGPVNCTAPHPIRNDDFGKLLGRIMRRPHVLPVPSAMLKLALGEMSEVLLKGQKVLPRAIQKHGYIFQYPTLAEAFLDLMKRRGNGR